MRAVQAQRARRNHLRRRLCGQRGAPALRKRQRQRLPLRQAHCAGAHTRLASDLTCFPVYSCKPRALCSVLTDRATQRQITVPGRNQLVTRRRTTQTQASLAGAYCCRPASAATAPRSCQTIPSLPPAHAAQNSRPQPCPYKAQLHQPSWGLSRLYATNIAGAGTPARRPVSCAGTAAACSCHLGGWPRGRRTHRRRAHRATGNPLAAPKKRLAARHQTGTCATGRAVEVTEPHQAPTHHIEQHRQSSLREERAAQLKTPIMIG